MGYERTHIFQKKNSYTPQPTNRFASRPFAAPVQRKPESKMTPDELENEAFKQNKFEAFGLQLKEKNGTITPVEQERLGVLQAKMDDFWAQRQERASRFGYDFSKVSVTPREAPTPQIQPWWLQRKNGEQREERGETTSLPGKDHEVRRQIADDPLAKSASDTVTLNRRTNPHETRAIGKADKPYNNPTLLLSESQQVIQRMWRKDKRVCREESSKALEADEAKQETQPEAVSAIMPRQPQEKGDQKEQRAGVLEPVKAFVSGLKAKIITATKGAPGAKGIPRRAKHLITHIHTPREEDVEKADLLIQIPETSAPAKAAAAAPMAAVASQATLKGIMFVAEEISGAELSAASGITQAVKAIKSDVAVALERGSSLPGITSEHREAYETLIKYIRRERYVEFLEGVAKVTEVVGRGAVAAATMGASEAGIAQVVTPVISETAKQLIEKAAAPGDELESRARMAVLVLCEDGYSYTDAQIKDAQRKQTESAGVYFISKVVYPNSSWSYAYPSRIYNDALRALSLR